jgi:transcriptional regulator with XRE-family HTH domain
MRHREFVGDELTGIRIRNARLEKHLRLVDVADSSGISPSLLSKIESGLRRPSSVVLGRLANLFGMAAGELAGLDTRAEQSGMAASGLSWPSLQTHRGIETTGSNVIELADVALATAMRETIPSLNSATSTERFNACKVLAALASRPLETLCHVNETDPDPVVREASGHLLATLSDSYCHLPA